MDNISKMFIYGTVKRKGLCRENADIAEDEILDAIYDALEEKGYELEVATNYVENNFSIENRQKRDQRLIDANNINWNGFHLTAAFAESVEVILNQQKEIKLDKPDSKPKIVPPRIGELKPIREEKRSYRVNPCDGCWSYGSMSCSNECPYGE